MTMLVKKDLVAFYFGILPEDTDPIIWYFEEDINHENVNVKGFTDDANIERIIMKASETLEQDQMTIQAAANQIYDEMMAAESAGNTDLATKLHRDLKEKMQQIDKIKEELKKPLDHKVQRNAEDTTMAVCIMDEASQCVEPEALIPLKLVMVGNHEQLPTTVTGMKAEKYDYQNYLFGTKVNNENEGEKVVEKKRVDEEEKQVNNINCFSLPSCSTQSDLVKVSIGLLGCRAKPLKLYSQSESKDRKGRVDLVFEREREADNLFKVFSCAGVDCFLMTETELGFLERPVLSDSEMIFIMKQTSAPNCMSEFEGKVGTNQGQICFNFDSLASVNLFIFKLTGMALGTLKKAATQAKQPSQLQGGGLCKFIMKLSHPLPLNSRNSLRQSFIIIYSESFHTYCFKVNDNT